MSVVVGFLKSHWVFIVCALAGCAILAGAYFWVDHIVEKRKQEAARVEGARRKRVQERKAAEAVKLASFAAVRMMESAQGDINITHDRVTVTLGDWVLRGSRIDAAAQAIHDALVWYHAMKGRTHPDMILIEVIAEGVSVTVNGFDKISLPVGDFLPEDFDRLRELGDELAKLGASREALMKEARRVALFDPRASQRQRQARQGAEPSTVNSQKRLPHAHGR